MRNKAVHHARHRPKLSALADRLRRRAKKLTGPRQAILAILRSQPHPLSVREIFLALGERVCDLATVYRSMHMLENEGMVKRFDFGDGGARFGLLEEGDDGHRHHLICVECAKVVQVDECFPDEIEKRIGTINGFKKVTHRLEFFGVCPRCQ